MLMQVRHHRQRCSVRLLRNILALVPCGKPQASHFAHVTELLRWLPGRVNFTNLEYYGGRSARTPARWFARPFPFARLAVAALGAVHPRERWELPTMDAGFVAKSGRETWGTGWFWSGMARAACWGLEVTLLAAVDVAEGGTYPLCACQTPGAVRARRQTCGTDTGRETTVETARAAGDAGAKESLGARWVAVDGGYASRTFVEGARVLDLHTVDRLRKDAVLRDTVSISLILTRSHRQRRAYCPECRQQRSVPNTLGYWEPARPPWVKICINEIETVPSCASPTPAPRAVAWPQAAVRRRLQPPRPGAHGPHHPEEGEGLPVSRHPAFQGLAVPDAGGPCPAARGRPGNEGGDAPPRHRPGPGAGTHLPLPWRPLPDRVCLPRHQAAPWASTTARPVRKPNGTFTSTLSSRLSSGPAGGPGSGWSSPSAPFPCAISNATTLRRK